MFLPLLPIEIRLRIYGILFRETTIKITRYGVKILPGGTQPSDLLRICKQSYAEAAPLQTECLTFETGLSYRVPREWPGGLFNPQTVQLLNINAWSLFRRDYDSDELAPILEPDTWLQEMAVSAPALRKLTVSLLVDFHCTPAIDPNSLTQERYPFDWSSHLDETTIPFCIDADATATQPLRRFFHAAIENLTQTWNPHIFLCFPFESDSGFCVRSILRPAY